MLQGTLHSCREEPATGMGSGKGNTQEARVPRTPAHGQSSCLPNLNRAYLEGPTAGPRGAGPYSIPPHRLPINCALGNLLPRPEPTGLLTPFRQAAQKAWEGWDILT